MNLEQIDKNFAVDLGTAHHDAVFYDVRKAPFKLYGLYEPQTQSEFCRLPRDIAEATNEGVKGLAYHTAGGRVRFKTNSPYLIVCAEFPSLSNMSHMPRSGSSGFDLYRNTVLGSSFVTSFIPDPRATTGFQIEKGLGNRGKMYDYTLNFPLYNGVKNLYLGLAPDANVETTDGYLPIKPIVYYGSSITQGGCASNPGNAYQSIISRRYNLDFINLGFSGSAKGEQVIADYMADLDFSVFVSDYDHNAPNFEHLKNTHYNLYETIRKKHPDAPYIMIGRPNTDASYVDTTNRFTIIMQSFLQAWDNGDRRVFYLDGHTLFGNENRDAATVDGCHPTDLGFERMATEIGTVIRKALENYVI